MILASRRRGVISGGLSLVAVAASFAVLRDPRGERADRLLARRLRRTRGSVADGTIAIATDIGSMYSVTGLATVLAASGRRRASADVALGGTAAWLAAQGMKRLVDRPRPVEADAADQLVSTPAGSSWPSGHPAVAAAVTTVLAPLLPRPARGIAAATTLGVAASRIHVGVHYPADVVAGLGVGVITGLLLRSARSR